jgi:sugar fermentation stimulation protein A
VVNAKGTYALILTLDKDTPISVGKLTTFSFPRGYYLYAGSALGGLFPRLNRHIRGGRKLHWHIDYLRKEAKVIEAWYLISSERLECSWYQAAAGMPRAWSLVAGFGSTGCGCHSHLVYFPSKPSFKAFSRQLGEKGLNMHKISLKSE